VQIVYISAVQSQNTVTCQIVILQEKQKTNFLHYVPNGDVNVSAVVTNVLVPCSCFKLPNSCDSVQLIFLKQSYKANSL